MTAADEGATQVLDRLGVRALSARSVLLSVLLGSDRPEVSSAELIDKTTGYGVAPATARMALRRMAANGDIITDGGCVALTDRHHERQQRHQYALTPNTKEWTGEWMIVIVTAIGLPAAERMELRNTFTGMKMRELRDGVWTRPDNIVQTLPARLGGRIVHFLGRAPQHESLPEQLWDLDKWSSRACDLIRALEMQLTPAASLAVGAAALRHLIDDPILPPSLEPRHWPSASLRSSYGAFRGRHP